MEEIKNTIWERVLEIAQKSPCQKRKVGCLIVNATGEFVSLGYNHNTDWGVEHCEDENGLTHSTVIHSEDMAYQEIPDHIKGTELYAYVSHEPCKACRQILNTVCKEVFVKNLSPRWPENIAEATSEETKIDAVHPAHYADVDGVPSIKFFEASSTVEQWRGYCKNTAMKYLYRLNGKEDPQTNAKKCKYFIDKLVESYDENDS